MRLDRWVEQRRVDGFDVTAMMERQDWTGEIDQMGWTAENEKRDGAAILSTEQLGLNSWIERTAEIE